MTDDLLVLKLKQNYPALKVRTFRRIAKQGIMNTVLIGYAQSGKYVIKIYSTKDLAIVANEHITLLSLRKLGIKCPNYLTNIRGLTYSTLTQDSWFAVYPFVEGIALEYSSFVEDYHVRQTADELRMIHLAGYMNLSYFTQTRVRVMGQELAKKRTALRMALDTLNSSHTVSEKRRVLGRVIARKLKTPLAADELNTLETSLQCLTHGDLGPCNIIFSENHNAVRSIIDWEHTCVYNVVWDIFKSICHCCKDPDLGLICSPLDLKKLECYVSVYLSEHNVLSRKDTAALKLMPKYYYLLDPFIVTSYILTGNVAVETLISLHEQDHFWLENNARSIAEIVEKYEGLVPS